ncbi:hypothetical protein T4B_6024 [Trichinella pseudospiralis]|uniref:Uncharacterized protein n=1 Tax=Trichinella pseudospiralis TaxID=6337 RepID=A0A0V1J7E4_TRIPS|nr:hypothetical protein T4B_6024 [Trichinella pseudospiralis]
MLAEQVLSGAFSFNCLQLLRGESPCKFILAQVKELEYSESKLCAKCANIMFELMMKGSDFLFYQMVEVFTYTQEGGI